MQLYLASSIESSADHIAHRLSLQGLSLKALKTAFIYTGGEVEEDKTWIDADRNGLNQTGINTFDYTITNKTPADLEKDLGNCDLIHVNGGNSFYLLLQSQKSGFDKFIVNQVRKGVIYTGSSAGSYITSPDIAIARLIDHNPYVQQLKNTQGFNLVDFIVFPHWGSDNFKTEYLNERLQLAYQTGYKIILLNDNQYVEVSDGNYKIIDITKD